MIESVIALVIICFAFFGLFRLSRLLTGKILVEHAAMRVARARAVGFNNFMCVKAARVAVIPVDGERLHPGKNDERTDIDEVALAQMYMRTPDSSYADGLLRYEDWDKLAVVPGNGGASSVTLRTDWFEKSDMFTLRGEAEVDGFPVYLENAGL